jgi:hypothetical protein
MASTKKHMAPHGQDHVNWVDGQRVQLLKTDKIQSVTSNRKLTALHQRKIKKHVKRFAVEGMSILSISKQFA